MRSYRSGYGVDGGFSTSAAQNLFVIHDSRFADKATAQALLLGERMVLALETPEVTDCTNTEWGAQLLSLSASYPETHVLSAADCALTYPADTTHAYNNLKTELANLQQAIITIGGSIDV